MEFKGTKGNFEKIVNKKGEIIVRGGQIYDKRPDYFDMIIKFGQIYQDDCGIPSCCKTEEHANANLYLHAPRMLDMIKKLLEYMPKTTLEDADMYFEAHELIKEATTI